MTAVYRMTKDGWSAEQAYGEMKQYKFEGFPGHPTLKHFVYDYYGKLAHAKTPDTQMNAGMLATTVGTTK